MVLGTYLNFLGACFFFSTSCFLNGYIKYVMQRYSKLIYSKKPLEYISLDGEAIIYSETKGEYLGVSGVAADIMGVFQDTPNGLHVETLIDRIANNNQLKSEDIELILDGIATLLDLGILYEK
ncbi:hypothetical protein [Photorhabdus australis]|uniref:hypothetical protein n=1 Tax=Photorhabdus australis TaxID=286156 RepID=UPI000563DCC7|nr:hypothetical protein [Photorhabdus australis]